MAAGLVPPTLPFAAVRASLLLLVDADGVVLRGPAHVTVDAARFRAFNRARHVTTRHAL